MRDDPDDLALTSGLALARRQLHDLALELEATGPDMTPVQQAASYARAFRRAADVLLYADAELGRLAQAVADLRRLVVVVAVVGLVQVVLLVVAVAALIVAGLGA